jgi:hypothetical protein
MRVLAWFALLLMIWPAYPVSATDASDPVHVMQSSHGTVAAAQHAGARSLIRHRDNDDCCGKTSHGTCHCDAMCGGGCLPSVPFVADAFAQAVIRYAALPIREAPVRDPVPPLRPPSA